MLDAQTGQGEVPLLAPGNENYGYLGKPLQAHGLLRRDARVGFVLVCHSLESWMRYGDRRALVKKRTGDAEVSR